MAEEILNEKRHPVILIDGGCVLCNRFARFVLRNDPVGRFWFSTQDSAWAKARGLAPASGGAGDSIVLYQGGCVSSGSDAVFKILAGLRFPWKLGMIFYVFPRSLRERIYSFVARNRYRWFGRVDSCALLTAQEKSRFLVADAL